MYKNVLTNQKEANVNISYWGFFHKVCKSYRNMVSYLIYPNRRKETLRRLHYVSFYKFLN